MQMRSSAFDSLLLLLFSVAYTLWHTAESLLALFSTLLRVFFGSIPSSHSAECDLSEYGMKLLQ